MDFLKEIEPHNERLDAYQKNKTFSGDVNALRDLARIYNKYVYQGKGDIKANLACGQCKAKMMDRLLAHRDSFNVVEFPIDGAVEIAVEITAINVSLSDVEDSIKFIEEKSEYDDMQWGQLRKYATDQGLDTRGLKKKDILEWLKNN